MLKLGAVVLLMTAGACATDEPEDAVDASFPSGKADGSDTAGALRAANELDYATLTDGGVSQRAANNIIDHRNGPDGQFDDLRELDAVPYVGPVTLSKLVALAKKLGLDDVTTKATCVDGSRSFLVVATDGALEGRFVDFDGSLKTSDCASWHSGTITYRCWGDTTQTPFYQINVMRNAYDQPQVEFNLVSVKNEPGGGDILFSLSCASSSGF